MPTPDTFRNALECKLGQQGSQSTLLLVSFKLFAALFPDYQIYLVCFQLAVASYLDVCNKLKINVVLIERDILKHLTDRVKRYSEGERNAADEHRGCHYFCSQKVFTFGVFEPLFQDSKQWVGYLVAIKYKDSY